MSSQVNTTSGTSFSEIKAAYVNSGQTSGSGNSSLNDDSTTSAISLSFFRNATFTNGSSVPSSGAIPINSTFRITTSSKGGTTISGKVFSEEAESSGEDDY
jgi:hypothetical protein